MKKIFYTFAALLFIISACKKEPNSDFAKTLLIGTWNNVNIQTKVPTGTYVKFTDGGGVEATTITGYNAYEITNNQLILKGSAGTRQNYYTVSSDSLYFEPMTCADVNGCGLLFARQK